MYVATRLITMYGLLKSGKLDKDDVENVDETHFIVNHKKRLKA